MRRATLPPAQWVSSSPVALWSYWSPPPMAARRSPTLSCKQKSKRKPLFLTYYLLSGFHFIPDLDAISGNRHPGSGWSFKTLHTLMSPLAFGVRRNIRSSVATKGTNSIWWFRFFSFLSTWNVHDRAVYCCAVLSFSSLFSFHGRRWWIWDRLMIHSAKTKLGYNQKKITKSTRKAIQANCVGIIDYKPT